MKYLLGVVVGFLLWSGIAHSQDLQYEAFHSDITIQPDASITVTETIIVNFLTDKHGIYRNIPYRFKTSDGGSASIPIEDVTVMQDGAAAKVQQTRTNREIKIRIGDPGETLTGRHTYVISYRAAAAINFFSDHDELYWNVSGDQWDEPLTNVSSTVFLPSGLAAEAVTTACYTGRTGSTAKDCTATVETGDVTFSAGTFLTIVVGWPKGYVTKPANYDVLRARAGRRAWPSWLSGWNLVLNFVVPIIAFVLMWSIWWRKGNDPDVKRATVAQYDPPDNLRPAEVGVLVEQSADVTSVTATIVDLAVRGYLKIEETEKPSFLALSRKHDYTLVELKAPDEQLRPYEQHLLDALFRNPKVPAEGGRVALSAFMKKEKTVLPFKAVVKEMTRDMVERGYYDRDPAWARTVPLTIAAILAFLGFGVFDTFIPGLMVSAIIVGAFGWVMPRKTKQGVQAAWFARGFREYLRTAERYRLQWQEREHIFERFLPYAMVFGVARHWSEVLSPVAREQPHWYVSTSGQPFNSTSFYHSISGMGSLVSSSAVSGAASGSSGFGGGSAGGGGGGGGGGGW